MNSEVCHWKYSLHFFMLQKKNGKTIICGTTIGVFDGRKLMRIFIFQIFMMKRLWIMITK